jgi:VWFA-related protein
VRGNAGKPVEGLRKEDFQLYDNGKLQTIATFAVEDVQSRKERMEVAAKTQVGEGESVPASTAALPERFVALTFDDVHLETIDVASMRAAAERFIDSIAPANRVGIFATSGQLTQDFTSDKEVLKQKLLALMSRGHLITTPGACPNVSYGMAVQVEREGGLRGHVDQGSRPAVPFQRHLTSSSRKRCDALQESIRARPRFW